MTNIILTTNLDIKGNLHKNASLQKSGSLQKKGSLQKNGSLQKIKVLSIFGTRPEAIKMVSPVKALAAHGSVESIVCVTAQHRELLDSVLVPFDIVPDYDLDLMSAGQGLAEFTARALTAIDVVIKEEKPDWVLVHGDTSTTLAASLAAFYNKVKVGHVEAGLRSYDKYQPFPEEINRKIATATSDLHFAPTDMARDQLVRENVPAEAILTTGNTGIDLMAHTVKAGHVYKNLEIKNALNELDKGKRVILMTAHRRENWGEPLESICCAVRRIVDDFTDVVVVYPMHPNPVVKDTAVGMLSGHERIVLCDPLDIFDMHNLMNESYLVLTDSGGLQEEAPALDKPVVVLREVTERPEGELAGTLVLTGTDDGRIYEVVSELLTDGAKYEKMAKSPNPFGDGKASGRIVEAILLK